MGIGNKLKNAFHRKKQKEDVEFRNTENFKYLDSLIHSGAEEIVLKSDIILNIGEESEYPNGIEIECDALIIDGNGHTIDACGKTRIFHNTGKNIRLKNITLINGFNDNGGALENLGHVKCENVIFSNNSSKTENGGNTFIQIHGGGAIANEENAVCELVDCAFEDNTSNIYGGGILNFGQIVCKNTVFSKNSSELQDGGAIMNLNKLTCKNTVFSMNSSELHDGGAICNQYNGICEIIDCKFEGNVAYRDAGAIMNANHIKCENTSFSNNRAKTENGGAISNLPMNTCEFIDCTFKDNSAHLASGGIHNFGQVICKNTVFSDNLCELQEGGAINNQKTGTCELYSCTFIGNASPNSGGGIINWNKIMCENTSFLNNSTNNIGGAINNTHEDSICMLTNCRLEGNVAKTGGGGGIVNSGNVYCENTIFSNNCTTGIGGAIINILGSILNCLYCTFEDNKSNENGSSIYNETEDVNFVRCIFSNHANGKNVIFNDYTMTLMNCTFKENDGMDCILFSEEDSELDMTGGMVIDNATKNSTIHNHGKHFNMSETVFEGNVSSEYMDEGFDMINEGELTLKSPKFIGDNAIINKNHINVSKLHHSETDRIVKNTDNGHVDEFEPPQDDKSDSYADNQIQSETYGADEIPNEDNMNVDDRNCMPKQNRIRNFRYLDDLIHDESKEIVLDSDIVLDDYEESDYFEGIKLDIDDLVIDGNGHIIDACGKTGIFYCAANNITLKNIALKNGFNSYGGAIVNGKLNTLKIINCRLINNVAIGDGGAIFNFGDIYSENTLFSNNSSISGGAINNHPSGTCKFNDCEFKDNTAQDGGGGISNFGSVKCENTLISNNSSQTGSGGAINNQVDSICEFNNCTFKENTAQDAGGICNFGKVTCKNTVFSNNSSSDSSGAIDNQTDAICEFNNCTFKENTAQDAGGICNFGKVTCKNTIFSNNSAENIKGGAITNALESFLNCVDCEFENNKSKEMGSSIYNESNDVKFIKCIFSKHTAGKNIIFNNNNLTLMNCTFKENDGVGSILYNNEDCILDISYGKIINNKTKKSAIYNQGEYLGINSTIFKDNKSSVYRYDGFDVVNDGNLALKSPKFNSDNAILNRNHIDVRKLSYNEVDRIIKDMGHIDNFEPPQEHKPDFSHLNNLLETKIGGIIHLKEDITLENYEIDFFNGGIDLDKDNLTIDGDDHIIDARNKIRIFNIMGRNITLKNMIFKNGFLSNNLDEHTSGGGAIKIVKNACVTLENCRFISNHSNDDGGAIKNNGTLHSRNNKFIENSSQYNGGAIENNNTLYSSNDTYENNKSKIAGAIYNDSELIIQEEITLQNNTSDLEKDIYNADIIQTKNINNPQTFIYNTHILNKEEKYETKTLKELKEEIAHSNEISLKNNIKLKYDGITEGIINIEDEFLFDGDNHIIDFNNLKIAFKIRKKTTFKNITFKNACILGNSLFENDSDIRFENVGFISNKTILNANLIINNGNIELIDSSFCNNMGKNKSLINNRGSLNIDNTDFTNNKTQSQATIIFNQENNKVCIEKSCFLCNSTNKNGGTIYNMQRSIFKIKNTRFIKNSSRVFGGAIFNIGEILLINSILKGNSSNNGGAIFNRGKINCENSEFYNNFTEEFGGAINNRGDSVKITNSIFNNNVAKHGGAISTVKIEDLDIKDSEFNDNKPSAAHIWNK